FSFIIQSSEENLNVKIESYPTSVEPLQKKAEEIEEEIKKLERGAKESGIDYKNRRGIESDLKNLPNEIKKTQETLSLSPEEKKQKILALQAKEPILKETLKKIDQIEPQIKERNRVLKEKQQEIAQKRREWETAHVKAFSIYLLKHDTKPDVDKPENRLLLFEVK
ncbi:MAG: hypothetical protein LBQ50_01820, partial [Planctomycetaceae bacterium]|nr:hypothetical protein [Planctomycetaceae bacterium]